MLVGTAIALIVETPAIEAAGSEPVHDGRVRPVRDILQVEGRKRCPGRAVDKENGAGIFAAGRTLFFPQEEFDPALVDPMFLARQRLGGQASLVKCHLHPALSGFPG